MTFANPKWFERKFGNAPLFDMNEGNRNSMTRRRARYRTHHRRAKAVYKQWRIENPYTKAEYMKRQEKDALWGAFA
jgi:hypothetical protein